MNRRDFLLRSALATLARGLDAPALARIERLPRSLEADVVIVGGGVGGCAAALAAARTGRTVILTEPTDWIGGQLTQQAVPPDEHPWIEMFGANASYQTFRRGVREYYRKHYPLSPSALAQSHLNPGNGSVSMLCHEPRVSLAVLHELLAPYLSAGQIALLLEHAPVQVETDGDRIRNVTVRDLKTGDQRTLQAPFFLDATELGDLLALGQIEHVIGFENREKSGEARGPEADQPLNQQAITCCFAIEYRPGEDHVIDKPSEYAFWRDYAPKLHPAWPGKLLSWTGVSPITLERRVFEFDPRPPGKGLWVYRRIADSANLRSGFMPSGITLVNWPQNDYWLGPLVGPGITPEIASQHIARAKQLSLSLLYWMQTEAPRGGADGGTGWPGLKLRPDIVGTTDGLAKHPYIRESRRIVAEFTVNETKVGTESRRLASKRTGEPLRAQRFDDSVGLGSYRIDLHPSTNGNNYIDVSSLPFQIPLGSLIPKRVENLLPACKNLGVTHVTNGCYRLHPVEWAIGEAAGSLASFCVERKVKPREVRANTKTLREFQNMLVSEGVQIQWPELAPR